MSHRFVMGEVALGSLRSRDLVLGAMAELPQANVATDSEVLYLIEQETLFGRGIGYVDAHLLASTRLSQRSLLWTQDKRLREVAGRLGLVAAEVI